jgi:hypothetical protein
MKTLDRAFHKGPQQPRPQNQKLRKRNSLVLASTFSRIAGSGSIRAISVVPTIVEKMKKKARSLSAVRQLGRKSRQGASVLDVVAIFRAR